MMLRGGFAEPIERRALIDRHARAVEQYLAVDRLCFCNPRLGPRTHERRAALGRTREPFGDGARVERENVRTLLHRGGSKSGERRGGKEWVRTVRSWWAPAHIKKQ